MVNHQREDFQVPHTAPIAIIGMHRSGTSFLAKVLSQCGVFMGADVQGNHESVLFMLINDNLFFRCHSTWNNPFGIYLALQDEKAGNALARRAFRELSSNINKYLGPGRPDRIGKLEDIRFPWGWKDPRTIFTLPVWTHIFPNIRIIHIIRHGVDVANSLFQRDWAKYHQHATAYVPVLALKRDDIGLHHGRRGWTLEQAFTLWEEYVEKATQEVDKHGENAIQLKYEDFLRHPQANMERILAFCGLSGHPTPPDLIASVDPNRAYVYRQQPELVEFADRWRGTLVRYGY